MKKVSIYLMVPLAVMALVLPQGGEANIFDIWKGTGTQELNDAGDIVGGESCNNLDGGCRFRDINFVIVNIVGIFTAIAVPITALMIVVGGIQLMLARGSSERVANARSTMTKAVIGFIIVLAAFLITKTVQRALGTIVEEGAEPAAANEPAT